MIKVIKTPYSPQNIDTDKCVENIGNRFDLVLVATVRARELRRGYAKNVQGTNSINVTALKEIESGFIGRDYLKRVR